MTEYRTTETREAGAAPTHTTTIVERRGGSGGLLIGLAVLIAVAIGAFLLLSQQRNDAVRTEAVSEAAKSVGDAADKVGDSAAKAVDKIN